jgi:hypothetical protein
MIHFPQEIKVVTLHDPNAAPTGVGNAINVGNAHQVYVVVNCAQAAAAGLQIIPERNDAAGTGWLAFANNVRIWTCADTSTVDTLVRQTDAVNFTTAAAADDTMTVIQINPDNLGLHTGAGTNPITQIRIRLVQGDAADVASVVAFLVPRYQQATVPEVRA